MGRDARLMYSHYVAYTLHKSIAKVSSIRGDEFCHRITQFCMFCLFSLCKKYVCQSDQASSLYKRKYLTISHTTNIILIKMKEFKDDNFKFDKKKSMKFSIKVEVLQKGRKHPGKRRNCLLQAISPVPKMFLKRFVLQTV